MRKRNWGVLAVLLSAVLISSVGVTFAKYNSSDVEENNFRNGDLNIEIQEKFDPPENWKGDSYEKNVAITNNSTVNSIIRVSLVPRWVDENGNLWAGDVSYINYKFSQALYSGNDDKLPINNSKWIACNNDGVQYYYYNTILKNGDITDNLLEEVSFDKDNLPYVLEERYNNKVLIIDVKAEAVMANPQVVKATWGDTTGDKKIDDMLLDLCNS